MNAMQARRRDGGHAAVGIEERRGGAGGIPGGAGETRGDDAREVIHLRSRAHEAGARAAHGAHRAKHRRSFDSRAPRVRPANSSVASRVNELGGAEYFVTTTHRRRSRGARAATGWASDREHGQRV